MTPGQDPQPTDDPTRALDDFAQRLRRADEQLGRSMRALAQTEQALLHERQALAELAQQRERMQRELGERRQRLATLLRSAYMAGSQAPLKLLLAQDRIADAQRALGYYRYAQREQVRQVAGLTGALEQLAATEAEIDARTRQREALQAEQQVEFLQGVRAMEADQEIRQYREMAALRVALKEAQEVINWALEQQS